MIHYSDDTGYISTEKEFAEFTQWSKQHPEIEEIYSQLRKLSHKIQEENIHKPFYVNLDTLMSGFSDLLILTHKDNE